MIIVVFILLIDAGYFLANGIQLALDALTFLYLFLGQRTVNLWIPDIQINRKDMRTVAIVKDFLTPALSKLFRRCEPEAHTCKGVTLSRLAQVKDAESILRTCAMIHHHRSAILINDLGGCIWVLLPIAEPVLEGFGLLDTNTVFIGHLLANTHQESCCQFVLDDQILVIMSERQEVVCSITLNQLVVSDGGITLMLFWVQAIFRILQLYAMDAFIISHKSSPFLTVFLLHGGFVSCKGISSLLVTNRQVLHERCKFIPILRESQSYFIPFIRIGFTMTVGHDFLQMAQRQ